jgi:hypothetical protein
MSDKPVYDKKKAEQIAKEMKETLDKLEKAKEAIESNPYAKVKAELDKLNEIQD